MNCEDFECPDCGTLCWREEADNGIGTQYGPWYCTHCAWSQGDEYPNNLFDGGVSHGSRACSLKRRIAGQCPAESR